MSHVRQQVRKAASTLLSASNAGLWTHVFETRIKPARDVYTFLMVYIDNESNAVEDIHPYPIIDRQMQLTVKAYLKITDDEVMEDQMDAVAVEVESILTDSNLNTALSGKLKSLTLQSTDMQIEEDENDRTAALIAFDWLVRVMTDEGTPETLI